MKLVIKTPKPRNPLVVAARQRQAGAHGSHDASKRRRRDDKQALHLLLKGGPRKGRDLF